MLYGSETLPLWTDVKRLSVLNIIVFVILVIPSEKRFPVTPTLDPKFWTPKFSLQYIKLIGISFAFLL